MKLVKKEKEVAVIERVCAPKKEKDGSLRSILTLSKKTEEQPAKKLGMLLQKVDKKVETEKEETRKEEKPVEKLAEKGKENEKKIKWPEKKSIEFIWEWDKESRFRYLVELTVIPPKEKEREPLKIELNTFRTDEGQKRLVDRRIIPAFALKAVLPDLSIFTDSALLAERSIV